MLKGAVVPEHAGETLANAAELAFALGDLHDKFRLSQPPIRPPLLPTHLANGVFLCLK